MGGALLAPPLYWAGMALARAEWVPQLAAFPFARYFNRAVLVVALAGLWPFLRWLGVRRLTDLGLRPNPRRWRDLGTGVAVAVVGLGSAAALLLLTGAATLDAEVSLGRVAGALLTGAVVALIEETFFRGALFGALRRELAWPVALGFLSLLFGVVHFIKPDRAARQITDVGWLSGFEVLPHAFTRFAEPRLVALGLVTLVIFGWILGWVVVRTESLAMSIGLHGGWVFALRAFRVTTERVGAPGMWLGKNLRTGLAPVLLLLVSAAVLWWLLRRRRSDAL